MSFNNDNNNRFTDETDRRQGDALLGSADRLTSDTNKNSTNGVPGVCGARSHQTELGDSGCSGAQEQQRAGLENRDVLDNTADTSKPGVVDKVTWSKPRVRLLTTPIGNSEVGSARPASSDYYLSLLHHTLYS